MTSQASPKRVLLATDLSARCDRALDRAAQLANNWSAELVALNILESAQAPDMALTWAYGNEEENLEIAQRQLRKDLAGLSPKLRIRIAHGDVATAIETVANEEACDLIVTGVARNETFGRFLLGGTVENLAQTVPQPLLVVRNRCHGAYQRIVLATDFSASARHALHVLLRYFSKQEIVLFHAHNTPFASAEDDKLNVPNETLVKQAFDAWLGSDESNIPAITSDVRTSLKYVAVSGALETSLTQYVRAHDIDLVVIGTHDENGLWDVLLGSSASQLLDWLPCDTMSIRDPHTT